MFCEYKNPYNLRRRSATRKRKYSFPEEYNGIKRKRLRHFDYITWLPDEILLRIFSYLQVEDLFYNCRRVCRKWRTMAMRASSWTCITANYEIPTGTLKNWIRLSANIKHIRISGRNDADVILEAISRHTCNLESITIENCWGSCKKVYIQSTVLCHLLTRCKKLGKINFEKVKIRSCKFFKMLAARRNRQKFLELCYVGPVTLKQYKALKESCSGWIFTEFIEVTV